MSKERQMVSTITSRWDKDMINAELINLLDRDYRLLKHYPQSEHPTILEFESNTDPTKQASFWILMQIYQKKCKVTLLGNKEYFIEVDDIE